MRICIYGAGAIGGYMGARLSQSGADVTLIARGPHLEAMQKNGLQLIEDGKNQTVHPRCTNDPAEAGPQDYVIITLKAPSVTGVLTAMQPLLGEETCVVTTTNGIPWWYFYGLKGLLGKSPAGTVSTPVTANGMRSARNASSVVLPTLPARSANRE